MATSKSGGTAKTVSKNAAVADPKPAKAIDASGAAIEDEIVDAIDMDHPAVDANPRAGTSADQNRIDFNDPTKSGQEAVEANLASAADAAE